MKAAVSQSKPKFYKRANICEVPRE